MSSYSFEVTRTQLGNTRFTELADPASVALEEGEALISVDRFALTANNITYGVAGDMIGYWQFFPAEGDWGRIPVWGIGTVLRSNGTELVEGERYYGYYPMSSYLVVTPQAGATGFTDAAAHRAALPPVYNQYQRMSTENGFQPGFDDHQMIYRPLFTTSFLIDDYLEDNGFFGADAVVIGSASSKTAFGLAFLLHANRDCRVVGLTSARNKAFVEGMGIYHQVVSYEELETLDADAKAAFVDMGGSGDVMTRLHNHYGDKLLLSCGVGITHYEEWGSADTDNLPGAKPAMFFAPDQVQKRLKEWGPEGYQAKLAAAWQQFLGKVDDWVSIEQGDGQAGLEQTYLTVLGGPPADKAFVVSL